MKRKIYSKLLAWKSMRKFGEFVTLPTVLHTSDARMEDGIRYLPLYMTPLL